MAHRDNVEYGYAERMTRLGCGLLCLVAVFCTLLGASIRAYGWQAIRAIFLALRDAAIIVLVAGALLTGLYWGVRFLWNAFTGKDVGRFW